MPAIQQRQPTYVREMMERLGIEPRGGVVPQFSLSYATAFHRCETCTCKPDCRAWLDSKPAAVHFAPRFCPDTDIFFELQFDQPGTAHIAAEHRAQAQR